jgi:hypothetical protein
MLFVGFFSLVHVLHCDTVIGSFILERANSNVQVWCVVAL